MPTSLAFNAFWFVLLTVGVVMYVIAGRRTKIARDGFAKDMRAVSVTIRALAFHHADDPKLRAHLIASLSEADVLCEECPLHHSEICSQCGRFASGEGRAKS